MNAQLRARLLRQPVPATQKQPLRLLGEGLDAIIQHTRQPMEHWFDRLWCPGGREVHLQAPSPEQRLTRYYTAATLYPLHTDSCSEDLRAALGGQYLQTWRERRYLNFRRAAHLMPLPRLRKVRA